MGDAAKSHLSSKMIFVSIYTKISSIKIGQTINFIKFDYMTYSTKYPYMNTHLTIPQAMYLLDKRERLFH